MKYIIFCLISILILSCSEKKAKIDETSIQKTNKDDRLNMYNSEKINSVDILEALDFLGVQIHKFELGEFEKTRELIVLLEEYENGFLKSTDTLASTDNQFSESFNENGSPNKGFIDQIKFMTKTENEKSEIIIKTYKWKSPKRIIELTKTDDKQFFLWRDYIETKWKPDRKIPLMIFASSWFDERINNHRFCGVAKLTENTESTDELLNNSTNYIMISYKVLE